MFPVMLRVSEALLTILYNKHQLKDQNFTHIPYATLSPFLKIATSCLPSGECNFVYFEAISMNWRVSTSLLGLTPSPECLVGEM